MFGREAIVEIEKPGTKKLVKYTGLDVKFNVRSTMSTFVWEANVSILNLPRSIVQMYAGQIGIKSDKAWADRPRIRLSVRYKDENKQAVCIFDGRVNQASVTPAPNVWLNMQCMSGNPEKVFSIELPNKETFGTSFVFSIKDICNEIGRVTNVIPVYYGDWGGLESVITESSFRATGSVQDLYRTVIGQFSGKLETSYSFGKVYIGPVDEAGMLELAKVVKGDGANYATTLTEKNGVIGIPQPNVNRLTLKTFLRPKERAGSIVSVSLDHFKVMNGDYQIYSLTHAGQLRQGEWTTTFDLGRITNGNMRNLT